MINDNLVMTLHKAGKTNAEIGRTLGYAYTTVLDATKRLGLVPHKGKTGRSSPLYGKSRLTDE